jgi:ABC-type polysaccharide/polyol phosphate transport system ATPase subunit
LPTSPDGRIVADGIWKRFHADRREPLLGARLSALTTVARGSDRPKWRWVLRDVNVRAEPGESVGIVGTNGSGKTTLLRLLTQVMYPYAGRVEVGGRVGALIDIRAGLHPDLSGAENVYFFGALLGLRRREVAARFDEIVDFAELASALDRPVKFYSSGMQMRLGFAAASFLDPAVLLVDEVLAVGDTAFQQRCLARLRERLTSGVTLVLVSHDLAAVEATCRRVIWLDQGAIRADGPVSDVLDAYRASVTQADDADDADQTDPVRVAARVRPDSGAGPALTAGPVTIEVVIKTQEARWGLVCVGAGKDALSPVFVLRRDLYLEAGTTRLTCRLPNLPLPGGHFQLLAGVFDRKGQPLRAWQSVTSFDVVGPGLDDVPPAVLRQVPVYVDSEWDVDHEPGNN